MTQVPSSFLNALIAWVNANPTITGLFPRTSWGSANVPGASAVEFDSRAIDYVAYPYCVLTQVSDVSSDFDSEGGYQKVGEYQFAIYDDDPDRGRSTRDALADQLDTLTVDFILTAENGFIMSWWPRRGGFALVKGSTTVWRAWVSYRATIGRQRR